MVVMKDHRKRKNHCDVELEESAISNGFEKPEACEVVKKRKKKAKKLDVEQGLSVNNDSQNDVVEAKTSHDDIDEPQVRKKKHKKNKQLDETSAVVTDSASKVCASSKPSETNQQCSDDFELMLNVTCEPVKVPDVTNIKKIPSGIPKHKKRKLEEKLQEKLKKCEEMLHPVGERDSKIEHDVRTEEGVKLCFKKCKLATQTQPWFKAAGLTSAKKSYQHLIKGDITLKFKSCNLHEINGYGLKLAKESTL